jgi:chromosome partitioning protein
VGQIIACANQKGGVGKTTTVVSLAAYLALDGARVLVVDSDPQGNATSGLGLDRNPARLSLYDVLANDLDIRRVCLETVIPGLDVVPSAVSMAASEVELTAVEDRERRLSRHLAAVADEYDFILIDCPPSLGLLTVGALVGADEVLIPVQCEYYALEGLSQLMATINLVRDHLNPSLEVNGIVLTMFDSRTRLSGEVRDEVRRHLGRSVYRTVIPRSVRLAEAPSHGSPIPLYRPKSKGAVAYRALARELRKRARRPVDVRDSRQGGQPRGLAPEASGGPSFAEASGIRRAGQPAGRPGRERAAGPGRASTSVSAGAAS